MDNHFSSNNCTLKVTMSLQSLLTIMLYDVSSRYVLLFRKVPQNIEDITLSSDSRGLFFCIFAKTYAYWGFMRSNSSLDHRVVVLVGRMWANTAFSNSNFRVKYNLNAIQNHLEKILNFLQSYDEHRIYIFLDHQYYFRWIASIPTVTGQQVTMD